MKYNDFSELPQNPNFVNYIIYSSAFQTDELDRINRCWQEELGRPASLGDGTVFDETLRKSNLIHLAGDADNRWLFHKLGTIFQHGNKNRYHFDVLGIGEPLQLAEYTQDSYFGWHVDFGSGRTSQRKLSLTVQLSNPDEYEGGDLQFMINDTEVDAPRAPGTAVVFPSFVPHRVTLVTRGVRRSLVGWAAGPPYR